MRIFNNKRRVISLIMLEASSIQKVSRWIKFFQKVFQVVLKDIAHILLQYSTQILTRHRSCVLEKIVIFATQMVLVWRMWYILVPLGLMESCQRVLLILILVKTSWACICFLVLPFSLSRYHLRLKFLTLLNVETTHS